VWSAIFLLVGLLLVQQRLRELVAVWGSTQKLALLLLTATILGCSWGLYIYGVNSDRVIETSLSYYINPLVNVLFGVLFLKDQLNRTQMVAVVLTTIGIIIFVWRMGTFPWIALALALSFGPYGLLRKWAAIAPIVGLTVETERLLL
jgi:chloramphenicol-sensitive protein RarD